MSVVVAIKDKETNSVWVGCDSQCSSGNHKLTLTNPNNFKIFRPKNDQNLIIGVVGTLRDANVLSCVEEYTDELSRLKDSIDFKYVVTKVIPKLQSTLKTAKIIKEKDGVVDNMNNDVILAYKDKLFTIYWDYDVVENDEYTAIGSGYEFALGHLSNSEESTEEKLVSAIKSSCKNDLYVNYPIVLMNTMRDDRQIYKGEIVKYE